MVTHLLVTRFALALARKPITPAWLESRFELFERYCLPSILAQTFKDFEWRIHVYDGISPEVRDRLEGYDPRIEISTEPVRPQASPACDRLVTTRLDSDDALAADTLARIQTEAQQGSGYSVPRLIDCLEGWYCHHQRQRVYRGHGAAFKALVEQSPERHSQGVYAYSCDDMARHFPVKRLNGPAWIRVVHGGNLVNRFDSKRPSRPLASLAGPAFPWIETVF